MKLQACMLMGKVKNHGQLLPDMKYILANNNELYGTLNSHDIDRALCILAMYNPTLHKDIGIRIKSTTHPRTRVFTRSSKVHFYLLDQNACMCKLSEIRFST